MIRYTRSEMLLTSVLALIFLLASWLYRSSQINYEEHLDKLNNIVELQNKVATLIEEVLLVENGVSNNFDNITKLELELAELSTHVADEHNLDQTSISINEVLDVTEQIKSTFSVFKNSSLYLPKGMDVIDQHLSQPHYEALLNQIHELVHHVILYTVTNGQLTSNDELHQAFEQINSDVDELPDSMSIEIKQVLKHVHVLINYSVALSQFNKQLLENQIIEQLERLADGFNAEFQRSTIHTAKVKRAFYLSILVLIISVVWVWHKQQASLTKLNIQAQRLQRTNRVYSKTHEGIIITDKDANIIDVNPAFTTITGYSRDEAMGKNPSFLSSGKQSADFYTDMWKKLHLEGHWQGEFWNRKKTGELFAQLMTISCLYDDGNLINYIGLFTDITQTKRQQEKLNLMAHYDVLTGLPNRALFIDRFNQAIAHSNRTKSRLAVGFLDLDNFKPVNDNFGHEVGDKLLIEVAERIKNCMREEDTLSRQGGDEFALLINDIKSAQHYQHTMDRIHQALAQSFNIDGHSHSVTASSGITLYPTDDGDIDTLLRHADHAMYKAKQTGRNRYQLFDTTQDQEAFVLHQHLNEIQTALSNNEFKLYYQPKVNMRTGEVYGAEALIRWIHPTKGLIPPLSFLPDIYGTDIEIELGDWVIEQALIQLEQWYKQGLDLEVSINIAAHQLESDSFVKQLEQALKRYPTVNSSSLQIEILESGELSNLQAINNIIELSQSELGINMALDDFGTGYSSLTHLRNLPAKTIKIDQSFIKNMLDDESDYTIIDGVIGLADSFHREVIAEGVETTNHGLMLLLMGCDLAQGYGIARPMSAGDMLSWLEHYKPNQQWLDFGKKTLTEFEQKSWMLQLMLERWHALFEQAVQSDENDAKHWPVLDQFHCHCALWVKRVKRCGVLSESEIMLLCEQHEKMHVIANEAYQLYQNHKQHAAREKIADLRQVYNTITDIVTVLDSEEKTDKHKRIAAVT